MAVCLGAESSGAVQNANGLTTHSDVPFSQLAAFFQCLLCCRLTAGNWSCRPAPAAQFPEGYGALKQSRTRLNPSLLQCRPTLILQRSESTMAFCPVPISQEAARGPARGPAVTG